MDKAVWEANNDGGVNGDAHTIYAIFISGLGKRSVQALNSPHDPDVWRSRRECCQRHPIPTVYHAYHPLVLLPSSVPSNHPLPLLRLVASDVLQVVKETFGCVRTFYLTRAKRKLEIQAI